MTKQKVCPALLLSLSPSVPPFLHPTMFSLIICGKCSGQLCFEYPNFHLYPYPAIVRCKVSQQDMQLSAALGRMSQKCLSEWCLSLSLEAYYEHGHTDILRPDSQSVPLASASFCRLVAVLIYEVFIELTRQLFNIISTKEHSLLQAFLLYKIQMLLKKYFYERKKFFHICSFQFLNLC